MSPIMPGRAVDIVLAAARATGLEVDSLNVTLYSGPRMTVFPERSQERPRTPDHALAVFAQLGVLADAVVLDAYKSPDHSTMDAYIPALGALHLRIIIDPVPEAPELIDPANLIAQVDAARAAEKAAETCAPSDDITHPDDQRTCPECGRRQVRSSSAHPWWHVDSGSEDCATDPTHRVDTHDDLTADDGSQDPGGDR